MTSGGGSGGDSSDVVTSQDRLADADEDGFRGFVVARWGALLRTAYLMTGDHGRAEDLVQTTLERMHRHWHKIQRRDAPEVYARRVMVNEVIAAGRRRRLRELPLAHAPEPPARERPLDQMLERDAVWRVLATLPPRMRAVVVLRYYEDLTEADTAAVLSCSVGTVKSQTSRGVARLREALAAADPDADPRLPRPTPTPTTAPTRPAALADPEALMTRRHP